MKEVEGWIRTIKLHIETRTGMNIQAGSAIMAWIVRHVGTVMTRVKVRRDTGLTAYEHTKGKSSSAALVPIGESVMYMPLLSAKEKEDKTKLDEVFSEGTYLGINGRTGEAIIANKDGLISAARSLRRRSKEERWDAERLKEIKVTPWDLEGKDGDEMEKPEVNREPQNNMDGSIPRRMYITAKDVTKHGHSEGCKGCNAIKKGRAPQSHSKECRMRIEKAVMEDPETTARMDKVRLRQDGMDEALA